MNWHLGAVLVLGELEGDQGQAVRDLQHLYHSCQICKRDIGKEKKVAFSKTKGGNTLSDDHFMFLHSFQVSWYYLVPGLCAGRDVLDHRLHHPAARGGEAGRHQALCHLGHGQPGAQLQCSNQGLE